MSDAAAVSWSQEWWSYLLHRVHPALLTHLLPFAFQFVAYWVIAGAFAVVDLTRWPASLYARKLQPHTTPSAALYRKVCTNVLLNQLLTLSVVMVGVYYAGAGLHALGLGAFRIRMDEALPSAGRFAFELVCCLLGLEVTFYYSHYAFHSKRLWPYHRVHHEITAPFGASADYLHPLEFASMSLGGALAAMACGAHLWTTAVFFAVGNGGGVVNHSGYRLPWADAMGLDDPLYHDFHHTHPGSNLSFGRLMDVLHGTNTSWNAFQTAKAKAQTQTQTQLQTQAAANAKPDAAAGANAQPLTHAQHALDTNADAHPHPHDQ